MSSHVTTSVPRPTGEILFALVFVSVGVAGLLTAGSIPIPPSETGIGPRAFPYIVCGLLVLLGTGIVAQVLRGKVGQAEEGEDLDASAKTDWVALAKLVGFVILHIFLIESAGWPVAAAVLFTGAAWSLEARPLWKAIGISVILALVLQYVFGGLLGVSLPPGPLLEGVPFFRG
ncbi:MULTISPECIES: tripartite tricarboxylate transporter TctB family protein [Arthrobacter]|uniref:Tripartite tricarboxylate transporter TctB family protein n=1 Tax=Arthrobacter oryzae TaxID=409290 RepID=A0A3N0C5R0_9MICC|nr:MULTISPECIES: tripartite tricarboxylate transporter TctB family protein [Arthrobacter]QYF90790.1 tripartite tricarboxylate transporter TctB family protein [Arthrobacter sp. PAMC25284]RNL57584.1 tripartite tricarboxylate transporter TctB family protein [Arthrobacter oryzae]